MTTQALAPNSAPGFVREVAVCVGTYSKFVYGIRIALPAPQVTARLVLAVAFVVVLTVNAGYRSRTEAFSSSCRTKNFICMRSTRRLRASLRLQSQWLGSYRGDRRDYPVASSIGSSVFFLRALTQCLYIYIAVYMIQPKTWTSDFFMNTLVSHLSISPALGALTFLLCVPGSISCLQFFKDTVLLSGGDDGLLCIWRVKDWSCMSKLKGHK